MTGAPLSPDPIPGEAMSPPAQASIGLQAQDSIGPMPSHQDMEEAGTGLDQALARPEALQRLKRAHQKITKKIADSGA